MSTLRKAFFLSKELRSYLLRPLPSYILLLPPFPLSPPPDIRPPYPSSLSAHGGGWPLLLDVVPLEGVDQRGLMRRVKAAVKRRPHTHLLVTQTPSAFGLESHDCLRPINARIEIGSKGMPNSIS